MTELEFLKLPEKAAAKHLANCADDEALRLLLKYVEVNRYAVDWLLGRVQRAKGAKPSYYDEAIRRDAEAWYGSRSVNAGSPNSVQSSASLPTKANFAHPPFLGWGIALVAIGVLAIAISFFLDVSVETGEFERVANIDRISIREMICWSGGFMFLGGLVLLAADRVCRTISLANGGALPNPEGEAR